MRDSPLMVLLRAISDGDATAAQAMLDASPQLAHAALETDASFRWPKASYIGDTGLHISAAVYDVAMARKLIAMRADVRARNRRGAEPLHYAATASPGSDLWNPSAQSEMIALLVASGANPNVADKTGTMALHRAVRTRSAAAVTALLDHGADGRAKNGSGSTPLRLAEINSGKSGSGSPEARAQQAEILKILGRFC